MYKVYEGKYIHQISAVYLELDDVMILIDAKMNIIRQDINWR